MKQTFQRLLASFRRPSLGDAQRADSPAPLLELDQLVGHADALRDSGRAADAALAYRHALRAAPARNDLRVQLGNMLKDSGDLAEAEAMYRHALTEADLADTHLQLAHLLKAMGKRNEALEEYRQALERDPRLTSATEALAEAGDVTQAQRRFDTELQTGGVETLIALSDAVSRMRAELDRLARLLPDALGRTAFPSALYDSFRAVFPIPAPPVAAPGVAFHIVLLAEREDLPTLFSQIAAIQAQSWPQWTMSVVGHSQDRQRAVELAAVCDPRIHWTQTQAESDLASQEQGCAAATREAWLLLLAAGAVLDAHALAWFAAAAAWSGAAAFICDEEAGVRDGGHIVRESPILRQVVDFDSLLEANPFGETIALRADEYRAALTSLPGGSVTAARTALLLGLAAAGNVGHVPYPLVWRSGPTRPEPAAEHRDGVRAYMARAISADLVEWAPDGTAIWRPSLPHAPIAVIIPTRDNAADLREMVRSLRQTAAEPDLIEILAVDNGSSRPADLDILQTLAADGVRVLRRDQPFNWSHLNNDAVAHTHSPLLVFANDDMRMMSPGWDARLRGLLARPDVGAVGARLLYDDGTVQHAGVLLGWKGSVIHDALFAAADDSGPACRWRLTRAVGAVTGAFLATRRDTFLEAGGFDAAALPVAYSDIDFCLMLRAAKLKILWTPAITLTHYESKTRGMDHASAWRAARNAQERAVMEARWGDALDQDPGVNPTWHAATLPFRLLLAASASRIQDHIVRTGSSEPWSAPRPATSRSTMLELTETPGESHSAL